MIEEKEKKNEGKIPKNPEISKKQEIEKQNRILRNVLVTLGILLVIIVLAVFVIKSSTNFKYKGVKFDVVREGDLIFYHTSFPIIYSDSSSISGKTIVADYNIYLRNDPRELEKKVPATGPIISIEDTAINMTEEFNCNGDGIIAIANLVNLYSALGKEVMKDENATCDSQGRYMILDIRSGESTNIENFGPNCYYININNCEILEGTERFILGMLVKINRELSS